MFCGKFFVYSDKCVSNVVKIKCVNFGNINDICDKLNFTKTMHIITTDTHISQYTQILQI